MTKENQSYMTGNNDMTCMFPSLLYGVIYGIMCVFDHHQCDDDTFLRLGPHLVSTLYVACADAAVTQQCNRKGEEGNASKGSKHNNVNRLDVNGIEFSQKSDEQLFLGGRRCMQHICNVFWPEKVNVNFVYERKQQQAKQSK